mgnify:CR=1 FL=1
MASMITTMKMFTAKVALLMRALNIMRKVVDDSYVSGIVNRGHSLCPIRHRNPFTEIAGSM